MPHTYLWPEIVLKTEHDYCIEMASVFLILTTDKQFLEEIYMYQDQNFKEKLYAQPALLKVKVPTLMAIVSNALKNNLAVNQLP